MSGLRLLLVTDAVGGVWVYSLELARALRRIGVETVFAVMGPAPTAEQREEAAEFRLIDTGLPLEWLDTSPSEVAHAGRLIAEIADQQTADVVQTSSAALLADASFSQPKVAVQHSCVASWWAAAKRGPLPKEFEWRCELVRLGLKRADAIVAPSVSFAAETSLLYDVPVAAVHNGRSALWSRDIPPGNFVFTAGRLWDEGKNVATLDRAASRLTAPFQAAGPVNGPNGARISLDHVKVLGPLTQVRLAGVYAARPIYASAAVYEPFGLSVLEAARAGCALVLSDIPTHREIWGGCAIFLPPRDDAAFADAIGDLLGDSDKRSQLGQLARARALHYSPEGMAGQMAHIYSRLAARPNASLPMAGAA